jgi:hypothetical protein
MEDVKTGILNTIFKFLPAKIKPYAAFIILVFVLIFVSFYMKKNFFITDESGNCDLVTLTGTLINETNNEKLSNVKVGLENSSSLVKDEDVFDGTFKLDGVRLPQSKIISILIDFPNGKSIAVKNLDLNNYRKYPISNCVIDLQTIFVNGPIKIPEEKRQSKLLDKEKKSFSINFIDKDIIHLIKSKTSLIYSNSDAEFRISVTYNGDIVPVNEQKTLYRFEGGSITININNAVCTILNELALQKTVSVGNSYSVVKNEVDSCESVEIQNHKDLIVLKIVECLNKF